MGRKEATSPQGPGAAGNGFAGRTTSLARWPSGLKSVLLAAGVTALLAVVAFGVTREATTAGPVPARPASSAARPAPPPRPAFTRAEEAYIQALWPIHGEVERSAVRVSLGKIFYKTNELDRAGLKARLDAALEVYRRSEAQIGALQPPPSLAQAHDDYLAAVRLFEQSALESLRMFEDGDEGHLLAAYPMSLEGSNRIRAVGARFWQHEFTPH